MTEARRGMGIDCDLGDLAGRELAGALHLERGGAGLDLERAGQPRPQAVIDKVGFTVEKIRAAGKIAGTLVTSDELPYWREKGVQFFYIHSDPFLRLGLNGIKKSLGR